VNEKEGNIMPPNRVKGKRKIRAENPAGAFDLCGLKNFESLIGPQKTQKHKNFYVF